MKLQKDELAAVASYVHKEIKEKNKVDATKEEKKRVKDFVKAYKKLQDEFTDYNNRRNKLLEDYKKNIVEGKTIYVNGGESEEQLIEQIVRHKTKIIPNVEQIRQEIIMKSLFSDETELKAFIKELVDKY